MVGPAKKKNREGMAQRAPEDAKEVGVRNPAEETYPQVPRWSKSEKTLKRSLNDYVFIVKKIKKVQPF